MNSSVFEKLLRLVKENPLSAKQGLNSEIKTPGMLCRTSEFEANPDLFYLVTEVDENYCDVIPGSLDGIMAGPDDIVLPKNVLGDFIFLSLDLAATLPADALGKGFAMLDDDTYNRIIDSQIEYDTGEAGDTPSYSFGLPYISQFDSRVAYHENITDIIQRAQAAVYSEVFETGSEPIDFAVAMKEWFQDHFVPIFDTPETALAAGPARGNPKAECSLAGFGGSVLLEYSSIEKQLHIDFYDAAGNIEKQRFEMWKIVNEQGDTLGSVRGGAVLVPMAEFDPRICLIDPDGKIHAFTPVKM